MRSGRAENRLLRCPMAHAYDPLANNPGEIPGLPVIAHTVAGRGRVWKYDDVIAEFIAEQYVDEPGGLWGIHVAFPDRVPPPVTLSAWRKQYPAFGLRMKEAERLRAEKLIEECLWLADNAPGTPARVGLQIATRQHVAERLDRSRYGTAASAGNGAMPSLGNDPQPVALDVDDATLQAIALAGTGSAAGGAAGSGA